MGMPQVLDGLGGTRVAASGKHFCGLSRSRQRFRVIPDESRLRRILGTFHNPSSIKNLNKIIYQYIKSSSSWNFPEIASETMTSGLATQITAKIDPSPR
jgi:hypothetical protein